MNLPLFCDYILANGQVDEAELRSELAQLPIGGLEASFDPNKPVNQALSHLVPGPSHWKNLVTAVPMMTARRAISAGYGLAASDEEDRTQAVADHLHLLRSIDVIQQQTGRKCVTTVAIQTSPGPAQGSLGAFTRSLEELRPHLGEITLLLEHCDALIPGQEPAKGFFPLLAELEYVQGLRESPAIALKVALNWGRSVIEHRGVSGIIEHTQLAMAHGLLDTFIFSGAAATETAWGPAWIDMHIPPAGGGQSFATYQDSLLTEEAMADIAQLVDDSIQISFKVMPRPLELPVSERIDLAQDCIDMWNRARSLGSLQ